MQARLESWIKQDRQWLPHCRIAHATMQLRKATSKDDQDFWLAVIKLNQKA